MISLNEFTIGLLLILDIFLTVMLGFKMEKLCG